MIELLVNGVRYEIVVEAEAGLTLSTGARWWGSRVKYRRANIADKRWTKFLLIDIHPFDHMAIEQAMRAYMEAPR